MNADGTVNVLSSTVEMGQGSETMMGQIVAEELAFRLIRSTSFSRTPTSPPMIRSPAGSRSTYHMGNAVRTAAGKIKAELFQVVAKNFEVNPDDLVAQRAAFRPRHGGAGDDDQRSLLGEIWQSRYDSYRRSDLPAGGDSHRSGNRSVGEVHRVLVPVRHHGRGRGRPPTPDK